MNKKEHPSLTRVKRSLNGRKAKAEGDAFELLIGNWMESLGFVIEVERPERVLVKDRQLGGSRWMNKAVDIYGLFDIVGVAPSGVTLWVQCKKSHKSAASARKKIDIYKGGRWPEGARTAVITNGRKPGTIFIYERQGVDKWIRYSIPLRAGSWPQTWVSWSGCTPQCISKVGVIEPAMRLLQDQDRGGLEGVNP